MEPWIGLDTETQRGRAVLVTLSTRDLFEFPRSLSGVLEFLARRGTRYVAWNADYDIQALLRLSSRAERSALVKLGLEGRAEVAGWKLRYLPGKVLEFAHGKHRCGIYDGMQFFGQSLEAASQKHLGIGKTELPAAVKAYLRTGMMGDALRDPTTRATVLEYGIRDAELAARLWDIVWQSFLAFGLPEDTRPLSPASVARRYWRTEIGESRHLGREGPEFRHLAATAYRGGRIETLFRGTALRISQWDIHSAYPSAMEHLPRIDQCAVVTGEPAPRRDASYALAVLDVRIPPRRMSPIGIEHLDVLVYPTGSVTIVADLHTWRLAHDEGIVTRVHHTTQWVNLGGSYPYTRVRALYDRRKSDPAASHAIKLVLNGTYGLLAEHVTGWTHARIPVESEFISGEWRSKYARDGASQSMLAAAHITGAIRARLYREAPDALTLMTDGVILPPGSAPRGPIGPGLGEWGHETDGDALLVGSGLYAVRSSGADRWKVKRRGWARLDLVGALERAGPASHVDIDELRAATLREAALGRAKWGTLNELTPLPRRLDLNFDRKRRWAGKMRARDFLVPGRAQHSEPHRLVSRSGRICE